MERHYRLECLDTGELLDDDTSLLSNPRATRPSFLRARYSATRFAPAPHDQGLYRFRDFLPIGRTLNGSAAPVTYQSNNLAAQLGLKRLFLTFSGYWPERSAGMLTGTFKECEAYSVCARIAAAYNKILVVASAGNTARAFIRVCSANRIPLMVVVPEDNLASIWSVGPVGDSVRLVAAGGGADYADAIALSGIIASLDGFAPEGGAKNVARRDGMATTVLSATEAIGHVPDYYYQAVGSGTGAIAAWEAATRLTSLNGYARSTPMTLRISQNAPFQPIHDSWQRRTRELVVPGESEAKHQIAHIDAKVLANRHPPYGLIGGLYDALTATHGDTAALTNEQARNAAALFLKTEGIDVTPAAAVAIAHLMQDAQSGRVPHDATVMLNVTGGGVARAHQELDIRPVRPHLTITTEEMTPERVQNRVCGIF